MRFDLDDACDLLARTPSVLDALLRGVPDGWTLANEGEGTFSPFDVVGHLIHGERADWMPRARLIIAHGEARAFDPYDRFAQREASRGLSLESLLDTFAALRAENLVELRALGLTQDDFARRGRHPALGTVTLGELLATWVVHDLDHLAQVARVLSRQYADAVGPWRAYRRVVREKP